MPRTLHPSDWRNAPKLTKQLALLALVGVVGGILLVMHFSAAAAKIGGPSLLARNAAGETLLANLDTLFLVDSTESRTVQLRVGELGLRGPIMSVSSDGSHWYLGDDETGMLHRCDLRARRCDPALQPPADRKRIFRRAHHVAFAAGHTFITDSEAHRVLTFGGDGREIGATRTAPLALCFPNGIVAVGDDLYVADTNNFRIAHFAADDPEQADTLLQTNVGRPITRANCTPRSQALADRGTPVLNTALDSANTVTRLARPPARSDRVWPSSVIRTGRGEWWVIQMANRMRRGDVIRYSADSHPLGRIALPPDADPTDLLETRDGVLVADTGLTRVHRVTLGGTLSGEWGPLDFQRMLGDIDSERGVRRDLERLSMGVIAGGVIAALFVFGLELRRQRSEGWSTHGTLRPTGASPSPLSRDVVWIPVDPEYARQARRQIWFLGAYVLVMAALALYLVLDLPMDTPLGRFRAFLRTVMFLLLLASALLVAVSLRRLPRRRLGVSRTEVCYESGSGVTLRSAWNDVRVASHALLIERHLVPIIDKRGVYLYPRDDIESRVLSHLPPGAFVGNPRLLLESLRRGNVSLWIAAGFVACYLLFLLLRWFEPELARRLGASFVDLFR